MNRSSYQLKLSHFLSTEWGPLQFSIARFYERRIRRIFPPLFTVITFTVVVSAFLFDSNSFESFGRSITATTFFCSNVLFWKESGYFDASSITKPLLHTWSLAVEEQFYIFFPLLLIGITRFSKNRYLQWIVGISLVSLMMSIIGVYTHQVITFYLLPTRAWELLFGSFLSLEVIPKLESNVQRNLVSFIGLSLIIFSICFYTESTLFPGVAALAPVLGASFIIHSGKGGASIVKKLLSYKPIVQIGLISYSLYLWHWPLIVFSKYLIMRELTFFETLGIIITTFIISVISLKFIEKPFRVNYPLISNRKIFVISSFIMSMSSIIGLIIYYQNGMPYRSAANKDVLFVQRDWNKEWVLNSRKYNTSMDFPQIGSQHTHPSFILWGDSHAQALAPGLSVVSKKYGLAGVLISYQGSAPLLGMDMNGSDYNDATYNSKVISFIKSHTELQTVFLTAWWSGYTDVNQGNTNMTDYIDTNFGQSKEKLFRKGLLRTINTLIELGRRVIIISDVPQIKSSAIHAYYISRRTGYIDSNIMPTIYEYQEKNSVIIDLLSRYKYNRNVFIIHPESVLLRLKGDKIIDGSFGPLYSDNNHLTPVGARFVSQVFDEAFNNISNGKWKNK